MGRTVARKEVKKTNQEQARKEEDEGDDPAEEKMCSSSHLTRKGARIWATYALISSLNGAALRTHMNTDKPNKLVLQVEVGACLEACLN